MDQPQGYKDVVTRIIELLRNAYTEDKVHAFFEGDPIQIADSALPCIIVEKIEGRSTVDATGTDTIAEQISIRLVLNKRDDFGASQEVDMTERKLRIWAEGRDTTTGYYTTDSLMYLLRTNLTLGGEVIDSDMDIRYDVNARPEDLFTSEAQVTLTTRIRVIVPTRS